jgi:cytochrome c-type biogenesis protein CcmE
VSELDLSPREQPPAAGRTGGRKVAVVVVLGLLAVAVLVIVWQGLSNATLYFRNADEAVAQREELGDRRFRLQGTVVAGSVEAEPPEVRFVVVHDGVEVEVHHVGDPPELFQPDIPVVLEGRWDASGDFFSSDRILVKHSEEYDAENPDRSDGYVGDQ